MSLDQMAQASARRTHQAIATSYDTGRAYRELVAVHRRRMHAKVVAASAVVLAVLLVVAVGAGGPVRRGSEPVAPRPSVTKPYLAATPLCGPNSFGAEFSAYVDVGHVCPTGPGRYLSLLMGVGTNPPFAFTLPAGWTVRGLGGAGGGPVMPALGGLFLRAPSGGHGVVLAEYPTEVPAFNSSDGSGETPRDIAGRLARHEFVQPTHVARTMLGGREAWRVDLVQPEETSTDGFCVTGDRCAVTFGLARDNYPGRSFVGVVPGVPSTAYVFYGRSTGIVTLAWTFGSPDTDEELAQVLASIDLDPPLCASGASACSGASTPFVGTWYSSVSTADARAIPRTLAGDWTLTLRKDWTARLARSDGKQTINGGWTMDGTDVSLALSMPGCVTDSAEYRPTLSTLRPGLLELVPIESQESCRPRSLVIGGQWFSHPGSGP